MKTNLWSSYVWIVLLLIGAVLVSPSPLLASSSASHSCPSNGWSPWYQVQLTTQWFGNPSATSYYAFEFRPGRTGTHQIEFSGPWTDSVAMSAYWEDRLSGQSGSIGTYSLGDKTLDLWSGNAEVYYTFSVWYNPVIPGGSATMEYRFKCAPATSTPSQQGYSSVRRVYDFNNNGRVDRNDLDYGFQPRYEECVPHAKVSSERCAEIDYDYDGTISIKDFYYFQDKYEG